MQTKSQIDIIFYCAKQPKKENTLNTNCLPSDI